MSGLWDNSMEQEAREDQEFDAGDLSTSNPAEEAAFSDYEAQVGSDEHEDAVADAREGAGFEDPSPSEE
jgi:hypothetical protein